MEDTIAVMEKLTSYLDVKLPQKVTLNEVDTRKLGNDVNVQWVAKLTSELHYLILSLLV